MFTVDSAGVIIPSHGGNFKPVSKAVELLREITPKLQVIAYTDLRGLAEELLKASDSLGVSRSESGAHAGEFETSMTLFLRADLVDVSKAERGFVGNVGEKLDEIMKRGFSEITPNGIIGDPRSADVSRGRPYLETWLQQIMTEIHRANKQIARTIRHARE